MDWKREAKDKLRNYSARRTALENIPEEIRRLEARATGIRSASADGTPVRGGGNGREDMLLSNIAERDELHLQLKNAQKWVENVDRAMTTLTAEERLVLERLYIYPAMGNVDRLCGELGIEKSAVYERRDKALRRFTLAYYGAVES